jgi:hypothetical protein
MAISSQINIDVEFLALKTAFDKYETAVKKMPAAWQKRGAGIIGNKDEF